MTRKSKDDFVIVALDVDSLEKQDAVVSLLGEAQFFKVGMELFYSGGRRSVTGLTGAGRRVFLDLKIHDIPVTMEKAVRSLAKLEPDFLTVFCGPDGVRAAVEGASGSSLKILNVTALTSEGGDSRRVEEIVLERARLTREAGGHGVICSARETKAVKDEFADLIVVNPGIRPAGAALDDQKRVATPGEAYLAGADHVVIGRPIVQAPEPAAAYSDILKSIPF